MAKKSGASAQQQSAKNLLKFSQTPVNRSSLMQTTTTTTTTSSSGVARDVTDTKYISSTSTSLTHVLTMILLGICRQITNTQLIRQRVFVYLCLVIAAGLVNDFAPMISFPYLFKVQKTNFFNVWFVKIGWFWTTLLTFPLMALTSQILSIDKTNTNGMFNDSCGDFSLAFITGRSSTGANVRLKQLLSLLRTRQLLRLAINSVVWFVSVQLFVVMEELTAQCSLNDVVNINKAICNSNGHKWSPGFDISGHTFLLIYSNLILIEESAVMIGWEPFGHHLNEEQQRLRHTLQNHRQWQMYAKYLLPIRVTFIAITVLSLIWDFMLIQTSFYYHSMIQKLLAALWAFGFWFVTYQYLYKLFGIEVKPPKITKIT